MDGLVFAFDLGKASIGVCVRKAHQILDLKSLLIPAEFASTVDYRTRRRAFRTRQAHEKRELWLRKIWQDTGLAPLASDDPRLKREFPAKGDETLYNSAILRIALLQGRPLADWQIFKALWASIQRRGYDKACDWKTHEDGDEDAKENLESVNLYQDAIYYNCGHEASHHYPCYLEAALQQLWSPDSPMVLIPRMGHRDVDKVRRKGRVAPRELVLREVRDLFEAAKQQLPSLQGVDTDVLLYGPAKRPYAVLEYKADIDPEDFRKYRGREWEAQGVLSQKTPRFDNRIINKCQLLPLRNVCKASEPLNQKFNLLMKLKNVRFIDESGVADDFLNADELKQCYEKIMAILEDKKGNDFSGSQLKKAIQEIRQSRVQWMNLKEKDKLKLNMGGRSRFCRPALKILCDILLSGTSPSEFDIMPYVQNEDETAPQKGVTRDELMRMIRRLGDSWEKFHVGDTRYETLAATESEREQAIHDILRKINNPVVRHRLMIFFQELQKLKAQHGMPENVMIEFVRGELGLQGAKTTVDFIRMQKDNERATDMRRKKLTEAGLKVTKNNLDRLRLLEEQGGVCPYTGTKLSDTGLSYYDIDHIVPVSNDIATDSLYNKVLCLHTANREKGPRTPYQWFQEDKTPQEWAEFKERVAGRHSSIGRRKQRLLLSDNAPELIESYNGLAETAYLARLAQQIVSLQFNWGLQTKEDARRIFVIDGKSTAKIRGIYKLNELLLSQEEAATLDPKQRIEKNRKNHKHHALDAYCISYYRDLKHRKDEMNRDIWRVDGLENSLSAFKNRFERLVPEPLRRNTKELHPLETIYGFRERICPEDKKTHYYLTVRKNLVELLVKDRKKIKDIFDLAIRHDLQARSQEIPDNQPWVEFLRNYQHPVRKTPVKVVQMIETNSTEPPKMENGRLTIGEFKDFGNKSTRGQFKHSKQHQGQIIYFNHKDKPKVHPVYAHQSVSKEKAALKESGYRLYQEGTLFYSGSLVQIPKPFQAGERQHPEGTYKLRTIKFSGEIKLEDANGKEIPTSVTYLVNAGFELI